MEVANRTIYQISLQDQLFKSNQCEICSYSFGLFKKSYYCKRCYRTICQPCGQNRCIIPGSLKQDKKPRRICVKCAEEQKVNLGTISKCQLVFGEDSQIGLNWLRYLNTNKQEVDEDFQEQCQKSNKELQSNKDLQKKVQQAQLALEKGFIAPNAFNFSIFEIVYELQIDYKQSKEKVLGILIPFFNIYKKLNVSVELLQLSYFFLLLSSQSLAFKFLKSYFSIFPSYVMESEKVIDVLSQKINSQFQNEPFCKNNKNFDLNFLAQKYHKYISSFFVNFLRFETQITLIDSIFISKSVRFLFSITVSQYFWQAIDNQFFFQRTNFILIINALSKQESQIHLQLKFNRLEQTIFKVFQDFLTQKMLHNRFDRYLLLISSNTIFQNLPRSLSKQYTQDLETLNTQNNEEGDYSDSEEIVQIAGSQFKKKRISQSYYEQENQELKKKLQEKNDQIKGLQEKLFSLSVKPNQQEQVLIKKMQSDINLLQKKIKDQQKFIEELTQKIIKQAKEKEDSSQVDKARQMIQVELKEMCNQIKAQVNEEIQSQLKANITETFQNLTPNKSIENVDNIQYENYQSSNFLSTALNSNINNKQNHKSFEIQTGNKQKNESFFSTIYNNHSRQNSQFADVQFMNNLLGEINQQQLNFQVTNNQIQSGKQGHFTVQSVDNNANLQKTNEKVAKKSMSVCDDDKEIISSSLDISRNTKKSNTSSESIREDYLAFDQSIIERLDKLQGLLLKDQKIISQLFFQESTKLSSQ
ncbi:FYVE zinc finger protein (macronuclear) [Tetrahymena thermophila SB210]|uniref:FYVE zinc finger protein n=1 Tax=Tetrahymena thermophila (strain SB210) TaxID=312017 RepID=I7MKZ3_TETTS|nr:FYVE zinc finger protein [Tetrahymena thermophila SB210]EAS00662.2 FYVE zinc finger protein [Tetrahymena thermophila SB210]|eukprot:XP_001020907.2 FYVE zinc finger protein [Tetrahymena thermophila SB210]